MAVAFETIATSAPTNVPYTITVSVDPVPGDGLVRWQTTPAGLMPLTSPIDPTTKMASGLINVSAPGAVQITASATGTPANKSITFQNWDNPNNPNQKSKVTDVQNSGDLAPLVGYDAYTLYNDDTTIEFKIGLFDYKDIKITGAEVRWTFEPMGTGISPRKTVLSGTPQEYPEADTVPSKVWYKSVTEGDGYAKIRIGASRTWAVTVNAQVMGAGGREWSTGTATAYFISPNDETPDLMSQSVTVDLNNGILNLNSDTWTASMPDQLGQAWGDESFTTFLYLKGQGDHLLFTGVGAPDLAAKYPFPVGYLYNDPVDPETENKNPHNIPILYSQNDRLATIYMSPPLSWGTQGKILNQPPPNNPPQVTRRDDFPWAWVGTDVNSIVGKNTWIGKGDIERWGGLPVIVPTELPADILAGKWWLFFKAYFNGVGNGAAVIWPDPVTTLPADMIVVGVDDTTGGAPYKDLITKETGGYQPTDNGLGSPLYIDFYLTPYNKQADTPANRLLWKYASGWPTYRLNT